MIVRADFGTENCLAAKAQIAFRLHETDSYGGERSFIYGPSTANVHSKLCAHVFLSVIYATQQRVEAFWSQWRRSVSDWWITECKVQCI